MPAKDPQGLATTETSAIVAIDGTIERLDLTNPTELVPTSMRVTSPMQMSMAGEKIIVADRYRLRVYGPDTAPPPEPATSKRRSVRR